MKQNRSKRLLQVALMGALSVNLYALNIGEAVNIALESNYEVLSKQSEYKESKENQNIARAAFLPKLDLQYNYARRDKLATNQLKDESSAAAVISYNLFNGLSDTFNFMGSKALKDASRFNLEAAKQDVALSVKSQYIGVLNAKKALQTQQSAYKLFEKQYEDAKRRFDQGLLARNDLLNVEVNMLEAQKSVVSAKSNLKIARYNLSNILGGYELSNITLDEISEKYLTQSFQDESYENRSELQALQLSMKALKASIKGARGSYLPKVDGSFSLNEYGQSESLDGIAGYPDRQEIASISASWNLYSGGADMANVKVFKQQYLQASNDYEQTKLNIKLQYQTALSDLEVAQLNLKIAKKSLEQAKENYEIVNTRFNEGLSSATDLIDANYLLSSAQEGYFQSYYSNFLAIATLQRVLEIQ